MAKVYDLDRIRLDRCKVQFPIGKVYYYDEFKNIVLENKIDEYLNSNLGAEWGYAITREKMLEGRVQFLVTWYFTENYNDIYLEDISIFMGLKYTNTHKTRYKIYYKVGARTHSISDDCDTFEQAFRIFKEAVNHHISRLRK